jgi:hypothetical protein
VKLARSISWTAGRSRSVIGSTRTGPGGAATIACSSAPLDGEGDAAGRRRAHAARQRHVLGDEAREVVARGTGTQPCGPEPGERGGEPATRDLAALDGRDRGAIRKVDGDEPVVGDVGLLPGREEARAGVDPDGDPVPRPGRQEQRELAGLARTRVLHGRQERLAGRHADDRDAEREGDPLRGRETDAQPREGARPGPDDHAGDP